MSEHIVSAFAVYRTTEPIGDEMPLSFDQITFELNDGTTYDVDFDSISYFVASNNDRVIGVNYDDLSDFCEDEANKLCERLSDYRRISCVRISPYDPDETCTVMNVLDFRFTTRFEGMSRTAFRSRRRVLTVKLSLDEGSKDCGYAEHRLSGNECADMEIDDAE